MGDIPELGWLFKTNSRANEKTNLFIFITPKVIQNTEDSKTVFDSKKKEIDSLREMQIKLYKGNQSAIDEPSSIDSVMPENTTKRQDERNE